ncbi:MAG: 3TM-type holin [Pseudomonadota bacterium]
MGVLAKLFAAPAVDAVTAIGNVFDRLFTSEEEKAQAAAVLARIRQEPFLLQAEINKVEAAHRSLFVAGWRPFIGWVCGLGFLWAFIGHPVFAWVVALAGLEATPPAILTDDMMELVLALLGLGALRTAEKLSGRVK